MDNQSQIPPRHTDARCPSHAVNSTDAQSCEEFEVTIKPDEDDPDRFHITSISPRPRQ